MSSSQASGVMYGAMVAAENVQVSQEDVPMHDAQPSLIMSDTFAMWAPSVSPLASPVPSPFPIGNQWENRSRPAMEADPQDIPVPESESDRELDDAVQDEGPIQEEAGEEEVPDEVQDEEVEPEDDEYYQPQDVPEEEDTSYSVGDTRYRSYQSKHFDRQSFQRRRLDDGGEWREYRDQEGSRGSSGRRTYEDGDRSHDRNDTYSRWTFKQTAEKRIEEDAFAE
eukprot:6459938-Amphidinium_carterae.1